MTRLSNGLITVTALLVSTLATTFVPLAMGPSAASAAAVGFQAARLKYGGGGDWYSNPSALPNLMNGVRERTGIVIEPGGEEVQIGLDDPRLFQYPLLFMNGHGEVKFTESEIETLRRYLENGGFLWADDNYGMDTSFRREMRRLYPESPLVDLPFDHSIYRAFYDFPTGLPKIHEHDGKPAQGLGLFRDGRLVVFYTYETDIGDGLEDDGVHDNPERIRELAMRMAVNIVVYVMTH